MFLGALYILVPDGKLSKAVKYTMCLCFLCVIVTAASSLSGFSLPDFSTGRGGFSDERLSAQTAAAVFKAALAGAGINFSKITVFTDKTESGGIDITKVYVYTAAPYEEVAAVIGSDSYGLVVINE